MVQVHEFSIWAPVAERVDVVLDDDRRVALEQDGEWWSAVLDDAGPGTRYRYSLDGGPAVPDPRSAFQPEGAHGPSEVVDHDAFEWTDDGWRGLPLASSIVYELHVGTFTPGGTFDAAIERLDHLVDLGIDVVELLPPVEFPGERGWGYDGVALFAPHHAYGGPDGLKRFIDAAHGRGLAVVIDMVYNHLGPDGNYLGTFGPYFTDRHRTPWGDAVNYDDQGCDEVRAFVLDNVRMWLTDYHADGLRLDAVHAIYDFSSTHIVEAVVETVEELRLEHGRQLHVIAESDLNDPRLVRDRAAGGYGIDAQWSDDFHHALHVALTGEQQGYYRDFDGLVDVVTALNQTFVYDGVYSSVRGRTFGRSAADLPAWRFLAYLQDHDQVGNRARGERAAALMSIDRVKVGAALVLLSPFVPMLFQGEEWGASTPFQYFTDHVDPGLGRAVADGRRREFATFGWSPDEVPDPQDPATFERSRLDWSELQNADHAEVLAWHQALIRLRRHEPALRRGRVELEAWCIDDDAMTMRRGDLFVIVNLGTEMLLSSGYEDAELVLASTNDVQIDGDVVRVPPDAIAVLAATGVVPEGETQPDIELD